MQPYTPAGPAPSLSEPLLPDDASDSSGEGPCLALQQRKSLGGELPSGTVDQLPVQSSQRSVDDVENVGGTLRPREPTGVAADIAELGPSSIAAATARQHGSEPLRLGVSERSASAPLPAGWGRQAGSVQRRSHALWGWRQHHHVPSQANLEHMHEPGWGEWIWRRAKRRYNTRYAKYSFGDWLAVLLPCAGWLPSYNWNSDFLADVVAGLTVGVMTVPQSLSYAAIAGLPSQFGLYGAFAPSLAYALFGSSRKLAVGPVAVTSLLLLNGLSSIVPSADVNTDPNNPEDPIAQAMYNHAAVQVSLLVGLIYIVLGVLRLGFLTNFLSHSVISGFTSGAAIVIGLSQAKLFVGFRIPRRQRCWKTLAYLCANLHRTRARELALGCAWLAILLAMKHTGKTSRRLRWLRPLGPLTVSVLSITIVWAFNLQGLDLVGYIPAGLPPCTLSWWSPLVGDFSDMMTVAGTLTVVGLMESIAIAKAVADRDKVNLDANQELIGLGLANLAGAGFSAYPATGSISRTAVNADAGARTALAALFSAALVGLTMLALTPVFSRMPLNAMAAIVVSGVLGLVQFGDAAFLYEVDKQGWLVWMTSFMGTLLLGIEPGLAIAVGLALLFVIYESAFPHTALLGRLPHTSVYRNVKQYPEAEAVDGMVVARLDAPMYFANVQYLRERLRAYEARCQDAAAAAGKRLRFVVIDLSPVSHIDASAVRMLADLAADYSARGMQLVLCNPSTRVYRTMERARLPNLIGEQYLFVRVHDAVEHCKALMAGRRSYDLEAGGSGAAVVARRDTANSIDMDAAGVCWQRLPCCSSSSRGMVAGS